MCDDLQHVLSIDDIRAGDLLLGVGHSFTLDEPSHFFLMIDEWEGGWNVSILKLWESAFGSSKRDVVWKLWALTNGTLEEWLRGDSEFPRGRLFKLASE